MTRPLDMIREAVKAGNDYGRAVASFLKNHYGYKTTPAVIGRLLKKVRTEQVAAVLTGQMTDGEHIEEVVCKDVAALIKKHGLFKVAAVVTVAGWLSD